MLALLGYLSAGIAYLTILVLVLFLWRGRLQGGWLALGLSLFSVWSFVLSSGGWATDEPLLTLPIPPATFVVVELLRDGAWVLLIWRLHGAYQGVCQREFIRNKWLWGFCVFWAMLLLGSVFHFALVERGYHFPWPLPLAGPFVLSVTVLILLEQWYRNITQEKRWSVKFFCIGVAVVFGYDFLLYSEALLFNRIDPNLWDARGFVCALMAPLMAVSIARSKRKHSVLHISHRAVFFSTGILLAGLYMVVMAAVGYYLRWFGSGIGSALQVVFLVLALCTLLLLIGSGRFRSIVSVWISKHFLSYKYDYREEWMKANERFSSLSLDDSFFEQLILGVRQPMDSLGGALWVRDGSQFLIKGVQNMPDQPALSITEHGSLLKFLESSGWVLDLMEYKEKPANYPELSVAESLLKGDIWLIIPLRHEGVLRGVVGLAPPRAERSMNWEDYDLLKALGSQVAALIALKDTTDSLSEARQFEAYNRLSAFIVHDIKNVIAQLSLVVRNAERHKANPEFVDDAIDTLANAVQRMSRMLSQLKQQSELGSKREIVSAIDVLSAVELQQKHRRPQLDLVHSGEQLYINVEREKLVSVLSHLVQNAQEATAEAGYVQLHLEAVDAMAVFRVKDNGSGMTEAFIRERLFKPFDTTKGSAGMGIGVFEARQFAIENEGSLEVASAPGEGSEFRLALSVFSRGEG